MIKLAGDEHRHEQGMRPRRGLGILGLGTAGAAMLVAAFADERIEVVAVGDSRIDDLPLSGLDSRCVRYHDLESMLEDDRVEVVFIATPTPLHASHVRMAVGRGRDVIVEKPFTEDLQSAQELASWLRLEGAAAVIVVGHSESYEPYVRVAAELVRRGDLGTVWMLHSSKFSNWLQRPRLEEELDPVRGGGLLLRQGVHQVDTIRTILNGKRIQVDDASLWCDEWDRVGAFAAWLRTELGEIVVLAHDGTGRMFRGSEVSDVTGPLANSPKGKWEQSDMLLRRALEGSPQRLGNQDSTELLIFGERGVLVATKHHVELRTADDRTLLSLASYGNGRGAVLDEYLWGREGGFVLHDAGWGVESISVCAAIERVAMGPARGAEGQLHMSKQ